MSREILLLVDALAREKAVEKEIVFTALELALASATKKRFQEDIETRVSIDRATGDHQSFRRWLVVEDGAVEDPARQISLSDAAETDADIQVGNFLEKPLEPIEFGRIGAQAAKQVIFQKIRDAEREQTLNDFLEHLKTAFNDFAPTQMLHEGIAHSYREKQSLAQQQEGVSVLTKILSEDNTLQVNPSVLITDAVSFMQNDLLKQEVFGPFSILVVCNNKDQMIEVAQTMEGQLTATIIGTANELSQSRGLINTIQQFAGRIIFNGVPTGVEVCLAMQHGGPYPAASHSFYTSIVKLVFHFAWSIKWICIYYNTPSSKCSE